MLGPFGRLSHGDYKFKASPGYMARPYGRDGCASSTHCTHMLKSYPVSQCWVMASGTSVLLKGIAALLRGDSELAFNLPTPLFSTIEGHSENQGTFQNVIS